MSRNVLIVAAHPDDEILGCGGYAALLAEQGRVVHSLILGEGLTSRDFNTHSTDIEKLRDQGRCSAEVLGTGIPIFLDFPDNRFDSVSLLHITQRIEECLRRIEPVLLLTHSPCDLNIDHRITCDAVLTAARPQPGESVREILAFETPSATGWRFPEQFRPDTYVDITGSIERKIDALRQYQSEMREQPHIRSFEGVRTLAQFRGFSQGVPYAEAFQTLRRLIVR